MTVADLQTLLSDLSKFLRTSGAARPAAELDGFTGQLDPFKTQSLKEFGASLQRADGQASGGRQTKATRGKPDAGVVEAACNRVLDLYHRAVDPSVTAEQIEDALHQLESLDPGKAALDELARRVELKQKFRAKVNAMKAIRQRVVGKKGAVDRVGA